MTGMTGILRLSIFSVLALAMLGGCSESQLPQATGKGSINAINAMPASPAVNFLIEERPLGTIGYKQSLGALPYDDLSYNFNFEFTFPGDTEPTRIATQFIDVVADTDYTLVLTGSVNAPVLTQWEQPERQWTDTETVFEVAFAHLSPALGDIDVYCAATGTVPVLGEELAKLAVGDRLGELELEEGDYEIIITARDDPATILYQSYPAGFAARTSYLIGIFDTDPSLTSSISVREMSTSGLSTELPDSNSLPTLRTVHAALGTENIDIYRDQDFTAPIYSDLGFGESTGDVPVIEGIAIYTYTAVNNPGAIINEESQSVPRGLRLSTIVAGLPGSNLQRIILTENRRPLETHAKLRFVQAAANFDTLDLYLVPAAADITGRSPLISGMAFAFNSDFSATLPGSYDLILTLPDDKNPVVAPVRIDLAVGDVVEALIVDTVDPAVADVIVSRF